MLAERCLVLTTLGLASLAPAQVPPTPKPVPVAVPAVLDDEELEAAILRACADLRQHGQLVTCRELVAGPKARVPLPVPYEPLPLRERVVPVAELRDAVLQSLRIVGHHYRCRECDKWHFSAASGFCIDAIGTVATCQHVVPDDDTMLDAALVVADLAGNVWPVLAVAAADPVGDLALLHTAARGTAALPLRGDVRAGERVYCASNPDHQFGYFSEGLVARRFRLREPTPAGKPEVAKEAPAAAVASEWLHVTCAFAKGSSGGPIVDAMGNLVGIAQSTSTVLYDETASPPDTQMVFRIATPASALLELVRVASPRVDAAPRSSGGR